MNKHRSQGFTLIELLVVIAIIGILSAVVLASLGTARNKAKDASLQTSMSGARAAAELYASSNNNKYQTGTAQIQVCSGSNSAFGDTTSNMAGLVNSIVSLAGGTSYVDCGISGDGNSWSIAARLPSGTGFFCVDSTGVAKSTYGTGTTGYTLLTGNATAAHTAPGASVCN